MGLRATELSRIRSTVTDWLPSTCTIKRADGGATSDGYEDATPTTVGSGIACRVDPITERRREALIAAGVTASPGYTITLGYDVAEIKAQDVIIVGTTRYQALAGGDADRSILGCVTVDTAKIS